MIIEVYFIEGYYLYTLAGSSSNELRKLSDNVKGQLLKSVYAHGCATQWREGVEFTGSKNKGKIYLQVFLSFWSLQWKDE